MTSANLVERQGRDLLGPVTVPYPVSCIAVSRTLNASAGAPRHFFIRLWIAVSTSNIPTVKVLVTGGTGFTGSHTAAALAAEGHDVRLMVRDVAKVRSVFEPFGFVPTDVVMGDMTDSSAAESALAG